MYDHPMPTGQHLIDRRKRELKSKILTIKGREKLYTRHICSFNDTILGMEAETAQEKLDALGQAASPSDTVYLTKVIRRSAFELQKLENIRGRLRREILELETELKSYNG